jgi:hypothetical protein
MDSTTTANSTIAAVASKGMSAGTVTGVLGWLTDDGHVVLIGLAITVLGFAVNALFRYRDHRDKHHETLRQISRIDAEEARAKELHQRRMAVLDVTLDARKAGLSVPGLDEFSLPGESEPA